MKKIILIIIGLLVVGVGGYFGYAKSDNNSGNENILTKEELKCPDCNLVIVSLTNTRKDNVGIYGYERDTTPNIDNFFQNSLIFKNAFAPASWTLPVAVSFYTSLFPYTHGVMDRYDGSKLSDESPLTLTEILKENGYKTAGFTGGGDYNRKFNFNRGFDIYVDEQNYSDFGVDYAGGSQGQFGAAYLGIEQLVPLASGWLKENKENKKFLLLQGFDTHCPFTPKEPFDEKFTGKNKSNIDYSTCLWTFEQTKPIYEDGVRYWMVKTAFTKEGIKDVKLTDVDVKHMIALYDGEIAQADNFLKEFFQTVKDLDIEKNTIFIFMSEHGDLFGEHGRFMRGGPLRGTFYDPVLNFPLLIKHPKIKYPIKIDSLVQTVDMMPTILDIFGLEDIQGNIRQGKSILPAIIDGVEVNKHVYAGSKYTQQKDNPFFKGTSKIESIRNKEWKLIKEEIFDQNTNKKIKESYELYNIAVDKKEENNLIGKEKGIALTMKSKLQSWVDSF
ncbi:MAG: sulfatase-like hydrolase/transferase [Patescibacteria group bacterium]